MIYDLRFTIYDLRLEIEIGTDNQHKQNIQYK